MEHDVKERLLEDEEKDTMDEESSEQRRDILINSNHLRSTNLWIRLAFFMSLGVNMVAINNIRGLLWPPDLDKTCATFTEQYDSPILDETAFRYTTTSFNGSFLKQTLYRQAPSPEVDAAWDALGTNLGGFIVPEADGDRFGLASGMVKRIPEQGGGFVVLSEGLHHLHCVDLLRQTSWFNYDYYRRLGQGAFRNEEAILKSHVSHCIDILRQQVMCTIDTGVFGQWFVKDIGPFVDFNTRHRCKNFEAVRDYVRGRQLSKQGNVDKVAFRDGDQMLPEIP